MFQVPWLWRLVSLASRVLAGLPTSFRFIPDTLLDKIMAKAMGLLTLSCPPPSPPVAGGAWQLSVLHLLSLVDPNAAWLRLWALRLHPAHFGPCVESAGLVRTLLDSSQASGKARRFAPVRQDKLGSEGAVVVVRVDGFMGSHAPESDVVSLAEAESRALSFAVAALGTIVVFHHSALRSARQGALISARGSCWLFRPWPPLAPSADSFGPVVAELAHHLLRPSVLRATETQAVHLGPLSPEALSATALMELVSSCPAVAPEVVGRLVSGPLQHAMDMWTREESRSDLESRLCAAAASVAPVLSAAFSSASAANVSLAAAATQFMALLDELPPSARHVLRSAAAAAQCAVPPDPGPRAMDGSSAVDQGPGQEGSCEGYCRGLTREKKRLHSPAGCPETKL